MINIPQIDTLNPLRQPAKVSYVKVDLPKWAEQQIIFKSAPPIFVGQTKFLLEKGCYFTTVEISCPFHLA